jgi:predicted nucleic acid-binding protein
VKQVFIDSGGFFAHLVSEDVFHTRARELFAQAEREGWHLVTTNAVVYETHALLVRYQSSATTRTRRTRSVMH